MSGDATRRLRTTALIVSLLTTAAGLPLAAQVPGLPATPKADGDAKNADPGAAPAPTKENPEATVAEATGPIAVEPTVADADVQQTLEDLLPKYPGVRSVTVVVRNGIVTLRGQVEDADTRDRVRDFARRVEGVRLILNDMKTDAQVMSARDLLAKQLRGYWALIAREWLVFLLAVAIALGGITLARLFNRYSETILAPFVANSLLRSVVGSILGSLLVLGGFLMALQALDLTQAVLSIVGLAGVVGLAVGFAFRDIAENFIASVLLGIRRPFRVGDYVTVAGHAGLIKALNTRATVLVTLEGHHVRIPNATIFKEILVNHSASPNTRQTFDVLVPYDASTAAALEAIGGSLRGQENIQAEPPPRALVQELTPEGVVVRAYYWIPAQGVDGFKINSDAKLRAKVALQKAGVALTTPMTNLTIAGEVPIALARRARPVHGHGNGRAPQPRELTAASGNAVTADQARANLHKDDHAAKVASQPPAEGSATPADHVMEAPESTVSDEGANLLN